MNILLIGDSWGVPNYYGSPGVDPEYHTEYLLRGYGYNVYNCSLNGSSNLTAIDRVKQFLSGYPITHPAGNPMGEITINVINPKIDWVVWFHTEFYRDFDVTGLYYEESIKRFAHITYQRINELFKELDCKIAIVGGQACVHPDLYQFITPDFIIEDWKSSITKNVLPKVYTFRSVDWVENLADDKDKKLEILKTHYVLHEVMGSGNTDFPDGCHPGIRPHKELCEQLDKLFKGEVAQTVRAMDS